MIPAERVRELVEDVKRRALSAGLLAVKHRADGFCNDAERCQGKASAYQHAAELVEQLLKDEPGTVPAGGER